jgi:hypothetical protein
MVTGRCFTELEAAAWAGKLISRHGEAALGEALLRIDQCEAKNNVSGANFWKRVANETVMAIVNYRARIGAFGSHHSTEKGHPRHPRVDDLAGAA